MQRSLTNKYPRSLTSELFHEMNRFFDDFRHSFPSSQNNAQNNFASFDPACEIEEGDNNYFMSVDLPGMKKEDIKIDMSGNVLTISGERRREESSNSGGLRNYEKSYGFFQRSFTLPTTVDSEGIEASYKDGVLDILLPKSNKATARNIQIQENSESIRSKRSLPKSEDVNATTTH